MQEVTLRRSSTSERNSIPAPVVPIVMAIALCAVVVHMMSRTPWLTPDSAVYLSAAHNLVSGKGLTTGFDPSTSVAHPAQVAAHYGRVPLAQYGPLYPCLLALFQFLGFSVDDSIRAVGVLTLAAFIGLLAVLAGRLLEGRTPLVALMVLVCVVAPGELAIGGSLNPWSLSTYALSDLLFFVFVVAFFLAADTWLRTQTRMSLGVVLLLMLAAVLTRYAGVCLVAVVAVAALWEVPGRRQRSPRASAIVVFGSGVAVFAAWDLVNRIALGATAPRTIAFHPSGRLAHQMLRVAESWFFPTNWSTALTAPATVAIVALVLVCSLFPPACSRLVRSTPAMAVPIRLWRIGSLFVVCYTGLIVVTRTLLDAQLAIDERILGPLQMTLYLVIASMIYWAVRTRAEAVRSQRWAIASVLAAAALVWLPNSSTFFSEAKMVNLSGPSGTNTAVIADSNFVVTTDTAAMYLNYHHDSILLPFRRFPTTDRVNVRFQQDLIDVGQLIHQRHGVVVTWPTYQRGFPSVQELETVAHVMPVQQLSHGGVVYAPD